MAAFNKGPKCNSSWLSNNLKRDLVKEQMDSLNTGFIQLNDETPGRVQLVPNFRGTLYNLVLVNVFSTISTKDSETLSFCSDMHSELCAGACLSKVGLINLFRHGWI